MPRARGGNCPQIPYFPYRTGWHQAWTLGLGISALGLMIASCAGSPPPKPPPAATSEPSERATDAPLPRDRGEVCLSLAGDLAARADDPEVTYERARDHFKADQWDAAASAFRELAIHHPGHEVGIYATQLYLECLNLLGSRAEPPRPACFDQMAEDLPRFLALYCANDPVSQNAALCSLLYSLQCDLERLEAEEFVKLADRGGDRASHYENAARGYLAIWRKFGEQPLGNGQSVRCADMDEILFNAIKAFQAAGLLDEAREALRILRDPKNGMHKSELARTAREALSPSKPSQD